jgi:hypothetical protein
MKKIIYAIVAMLAVVSIAGAVSAAGAQTYKWNLSGAVMPVPPYGLHDIAGSDAASKLIVNQPSGKVVANVTGVMNGLLPNTTYTVYISKPYTPYQQTGWDVSGVYTMDTLYQSGHYFYTLTLSQSGSTVLGNLYDPYLPGDLPVSGNLSGNDLTFSVTYPGGWQGTRTFTGVIDNTGAISGAWDETGPENGADSWSTIAGNATKLFSGNVSWPGLLSGLIQPFTFTTDADGSGSWHQNFKSPDFSLPLNFSVWINGSGATVLISDSISLFK